MGTTPPPHTNKNAIPNNDITLSDHHLPMNQYLYYINSTEWKQKSRNIQKMTKNRCIVFPWLRSNHTHHLTYRNLKHEIAIRDCVPVSKFAHKILHLKLFWKTPLRTPINYVLRMFMLMSMFISLFRKWWHLLSIWNVSDIILVTKHK